MAGNSFSVQMPRRLIVDEIIGTGTAQVSGVTGWTVKGMPSIRYNSWLAPAPPSTSVKVLANSASTSAGTRTITSGITNPDYPRAVKLAASTSQTPTGNVVITGTDQFGAAATDTIALGGVGATSVDGAVAFKTITSIVMPATTSGTGTQAAYTLSIGLSNIFGLDRSVATVAAAIRAAVNGTAETTAPIVNATYATAKPSTAATSSATALVEVLFVAQDTSHL